MNIIEAIEKEQRNIAELLDILDRADREGKKLTPKAIAILDELRESTGETVKGLKRHIDELTTEG